MINNIINDLIDEINSIYSNVEAIALVGSYAKGNATDNSDVDICVIGSFEDFKFSRKVFLREGMEVKLSTGTWKWYEEVIEDYEQKDGVGTITDMIAFGKLLSGDEKKWDSLCKLARKSYDDGPKDIDDEFIEASRIRITELYKDYSDVSLSEIEKRWLAMKVIDSILELHYRLNNWWAVKEKFKLADLKNRDSGLYNLVKYVVVDNEYYLELIVNHVLGPVGGLFEEEWEKVYE